MSGAGPGGAEQGSAQRCGDIRGAEVGAAEADVGGQGVAGRHVGHGPVGADVADATVADRGHAHVAVTVDGEGVEELLAGALLAAGISDTGLHRYAMLGMVNHTVQWYRPRGPLTPEQIADGYVDLVIGGSPPGVQTLIDPPHGQESRT